MQVELLAGLPYQSATEGQGSPIHQPQIYGTQFYTKPNDPATQEPYNRGLVSDALRRELGVPSQAAQEEQRKKYDAEQSHP